MVGNIIVVGGVHHNTLGVVRALGTRNIGVDLITIGGVKDRYVSSSRYVIKHHALKDVKELASYLLYREAPADGKKELLSPVLIKLQSILTLIVMHWKGDTSSPAMTSRAKWCS